MMKLSLRRSKWLVLMVMVCSMMACKQPALYERLANIPNARWEQSFVPNFPFEITDTTAYYNVYVVLRHTNLYPYRNIWVNAGIQYPGDSVRVQQFELPLASGESWLGVGMDDVYERRILLLPKPVKFARAGTINFTLQHTMRINPLPEILQAGIRVEPVQQ